MTAMINNETGNITTTAIHSLYDLGTEYVRACGHLEPEIMADCTDESGDIDYERVATWMLDSPLEPVIGEFVDQQDHHGRLSAAGFTWFRDAFDNEFWAAITAAYPEAAVK